MSQAPRAYSYICPTCNRELRSSKRLIGKRVKCLKCKSENVLPASSEIVQCDVQVIAQPAPIPPPISEAPQINPSTARLPYISASQIQVSGETLVLFGTLAVAGSIFVFLSLSTAFIFAILILLAYIETTSAQKSLRHSATHINSQSYPKLDRLVQTAARRLTMPTPEFYVANDDELNAYATGFNNPGTIVLNSSLVNAMNDEETMFIIGHELTHLKCGHCKYLLFTNATVGSSINYITAMLVDLVFKFWSRKSEFTCARGGVIACKNPTAAMTALAKLEITDINSVHAFVHASVQGSRETDNFLSTHPDTANRISAIWQYANSVEYSNLVSVAP